MSKVGELAARMFQFEMDLASMADEIARLRWKIRAMESERAIESKTHHIISGMDSTTRDGIVTVTPIIVKELV